MVPRPARNLTQTREASCFARKEKKRPTQDRSERGKGGRGKSQGRRCKMKSRPKPRRSDWMRRRFWKRVKFIEIFTGSFGCPNSSKSEAKALARCVESGLILRGI